MTGSGAANPRDDDRIPTIEPEVEPEYVGAHSALKHYDCGNYVGETREELEQCGAKATHTVVMWTGKRLIQMAMCDDCGEPDDVSDHEREWTGELFDDLEVFV